MINELKFSEQVKELISTSRQICLDLGYAKICPEMFILALLRDNDPKPRYGAYMSLLDMKVDIVHLKNTLIRNIQESVEKAPPTEFANIPLTTPAEKVLSGSYQISVRLGVSKTIDTVHVLGSFLDNLSKNQKSEYNHALNLSLKTLKRHVYLDSSDYAHPIFPLTEPVPNTAIEIDNWISSFTVKSSKKASPLSLYFNTDEFSPTEIKEMISMLNELYHLQSGDHLVIKGMSQLQVINHLECV